MKKTRLVESSLHYRIKQGLSLHKTGESIVTTKAQSVFYLKHSNMDESAEVKAYVGGILQENTAYTVNYVKGSVTFSSPLPIGSEVSFDYSYCPFFFYEEGVSPQSSDDFKYPAIAIYEDGSSLHPYELGNSGKETYADWIIEVWCELGGERNDATDAILEIFDEEIAIIDYNQSFPILRDGTRNEGFNPDAQTIAYASCESINCTKSGSLDIGKKPRYLSEIFVSLKYMI